MSAKWNNVKSGSKTWVHSAAALTAGHVVYNVKYLGAVDVSSPKGADIVKEAVTKLKFNKQVKRSEGAKPPKMELTISVDGITIQDRQTKEKQFTYPLHHISYCADDKSDKKICAFIAKVSQENRNVCHVMESDKNAEEITLTVGQAFDLAYQKFLSNANKTQEQQQQNDTLRKRVDELEDENKKLKQRINELEIQQGLKPSYTLPLNGEQSFNNGFVKYNPFNQRSDSTFGQSSSEPVTAINLLVDLKVSQPSSPSGFSQDHSTTKDTLAMQAAAYKSTRTNSTSSSSAFDDAFAPPITLAPVPSAPPAPSAPKTVEPFIPPPPAPIQRTKEAPSPLFKQPPPADLQSSTSTVPPSQPSVDPAIARSRPRPQPLSQGTGVLAPPPRAMRRGDSVTSPPPTSPSVGLDDLYAAVSKASKMNGSGAATTSPNPFAASSNTEFKFGDDLDFLSNKGSSNVSTSNTGASSNSFSIMDLDPLK